MNLEDILIRIKKFLIEKKRRYANRTIRLKEWIKKKLSSDTMKGLKNFLIFITAYGLAINFSIHYIFNITFSFADMLAWGIAFYFIKEEFAKILIMIIHSGTSRRGIIYKEKQK